MQKKLALLLLGIILSTKIYAQDCASSSTTLEAIKCIETKINNQSKIDIPIGTIISSLIPPRLFNQKYGSQWVLADGRRISTQYKFAIITGYTTIPDARGVFLRGMNIGRTDSLGDPDGNNRKIGDFQSDELGSHSHPMGVNGADTTTMVPGGAHQRLAHFLSDGYGGGGMKTTHATGTKENRPKNISVFYYVKIN